MTKEEWQADIARVIKERAEDAVEWLQLYGPESRIDGRLEDFINTNEYHWAKDLRPRIKVIVLLDGQPI